MEHYVQGIGQITTTCYVNEFITTAARIYTLKLYCTTTLPITASVQTDYVDWCQDLEVFFSYSADYIFFAIISDLLFRS
jgi:hypothetical protein